MKDVIILLGIFTLQHCEWRCDFVLVLSAGGDVFCLFICVQYMCVSTVSAAETAQHIRHLGLCLAMLTPVKVCFLVCIPKVSEK